MLKKFILILSVLELISHRLRSILSITPIKCRVESNVKDASNRILVLCAKVSRIAGWQRVVLKSEETILGRDQ